MLRHPKEQPRGCLNGATSSRNSGAEARFAAPAPPPQFLLDAHPTAAGTLAHWRELFRRRFCRSRAPPTVLSQLTNEFDEIFGFAEVEIEAGEADIGDLIECGECVQDEAADVVARHLVVAGGLDLTDDGIDEPFGAHRVDWALEQGIADRACELLPIERLALSVPFDDGQVERLGALDGAEAAAAFGTAAAASDCLAIEAMA